MKHTLKITLLLVGFFLITQVVGLGIINQYIDHKAISEKGRVEFEALPYNIERPALEEQTSFIYIIVAIIIATIIVLILVRFKKVRWWKAWLYASVTACMTIALAKMIGQNIAFILSAIAGYWKVFRPNVIIHNLTEILIYGGLAVIFVPVMNVFAAVAMLLIISLYDMYAVWKSQHMITIANFQKESKVFAGLYIPYKLGKTAKEGKAVKSAVLGGGDIGFPLIFTGVVMKSMIIDYQPATGFLMALIITLCASIALLGLLLMAKKDRYYPAMPFITAGCLIGYGIIANLIIY